MGCRLVEVTATLTLIVYCPCLDKGEVAAFQSLQLLQIL